jgi:hypothetical protein
MAAFDWVNRLFQGGEQTRGLSGALGGAVALDDANSFYNFRLRRHYTDADLGVEPERLWHTNDDPEARTGLGRHVMEVLAEGQRFTDVVIILSGEDYDHALEIDAGFQERVARVLGDAFEAFLDERSAPRAARRLGVWVVREGSPEIGGTDFGLVDGEFVTGILPNLYRAPGPRSRPVLALHANAPGVWEGYREIGRLYDDQLLFAVGNHWLDNFSHPSLREAALYRLQLDDDGGFFHVVNPDLQDRYQVTTTDQGGISVISLATRDGEALLHLVLWSLDQEEPASPVAEAPAGVATPDIAPPMMLDDEVMLVEPLPRSPGPKTIIPEAHKERIFTLQERGALLQKVHFGAFMLGYDVYVGKRGEVGTAVPSPVASFEVRKRTVSLVALGDGVVLGGESLPKGESRLIEGDATIEVGGQRLDYRDLRVEQSEAWPYVGEIRRAASSTYMLWGREYTVGRSRECRVVLPDEPQNANIVWKPKIGDGATIRSKNGEIPKSRFYTDSIMVASEHASIDLQRDVPQLVCQARHCYAYIRRRGEVLVLHPAESAQMPQRLDLEPADEVLVGNCVFQVAFTSAVDDRMDAVPAPAISSDALVDSVSLPDFDEAEPPPQRFVALDSLEEVPWGNRPQRAGGPSTPSFSIEAEVGSDALGNLPPVFDDEEVIEVPRPPAPARPALPAAPAAALPAAAPPAAAPPAAAPPPASVTEPMLDLDTEEVELDSISEPDSGLDAEPSIQLSTFDPTDAPAPSRTWLDDPTEAPEPPRLRRDDPADAPSPRWKPSTRDEVPARAVPPVRTTAPPQRAVPPPAPGTPPAAAAPSAPVVPTAGAEAVGEVVIVDDADARFELGRPARLVLEGWAVKGNVVCGNHRGADLILPENRVESDQAFAARSYFSLRVRGQKCSLELLDAEELRVDGEAPGADRYEHADQHEVSVIRRDEEGEEDFVVTLRVVADSGLPDPRARLVSIDTSEPLVLALVAQGLPLRAPRRVTLEGVSFAATFDGEGLVVSDYLDSYRQGERFAPFFVQEGAAPFRTMPEDGASVRLAPEDRLVVGRSVVRFRVNR